MVVENYCDCFNYKSFVFSHISVIPFKVVPMGSSTPMETHSAAMLEVFNPYGLQQGRYTVFNVLQTLKMTSVWVFCRLGKWKSHWDLGQVRHQRNAFLGTNSVTGRAIWREVLSYCFDRPSAHLRLFSASFWHLASVYFINICLFFKIYSGVASDVRLL